MAHAAEERTETPGSPYDAFLKEEPALPVCLQCTRKDRCTVVTMWSDGLAGCVAQTFVAMWAFVVEADGERGWHVAGAQVE